MILLGSVQVIHHQVRGVGGLDQNDDNNDAYRGVGGLGHK